MPEIICEYCGKRIFHENESTLKIEESIHKKFCRKKSGESYSYMHKDNLHTNSIDIEREVDANSKPILKR